MREGAKTRKRTQRERDTEGERYRGREIQRERDTEGERHIQRDRGRPIETQRDREKDKKKTVGDRERER